MEENFDEKAEKSAASVSEQTIGSTLARTLLDELKADRLPEPKKKHKDEWVGELCSSIPIRGGKIDFQQKEGKDLPKFEFSPALSSGFSEEDCKRLFCMVHGEFVPSGCTASEHAYPYAKMRENQRRLLDFLNPKENKEIADAFLHFEGISDYFRYDKDGIIKGSIYFYKHCYNIMDNLFLMCQGCNGSKGSKDPLSWFLEQDSYFGEPFVQHVQRLGGLQEGVLFHRVYPVEERYLTISLEEGVVLHLPDELIDAKGLGIVVRDWFFEHYKDIFETHKFFYQENFKPLKKHLESLGKSLLGEHAEIATKLQLKLVKEMKTLFNIQDSLLSRQTSILGQAQAGGVPEYSSPSSQDSDDDAKFDRLSNIRAAELFRDAQKGIHLTRKVRRIIKRLYEKEMAESIYLYMDNYFLRNNVLSGDEWQKMYIAFLNYMSDFNGHGKEPSAIEQELKLKLFELHEAEQEKHGVVRAEKLAAEHAISLKKDAKILELERQIALLKEATEEKKEADKMDEDSPHDEESPPRSPSSTAPANSFFGKEEELKSDKKRKREEEQTEDSPPKHKFGKTGE